MDGWIVRRTGRFVECWKSIEVETTISTALGDWNVTPSSYGAAYPVAFAATPIVQVTALSEGHSVGTVIDEAGIDNKSRTPNVMVSRPAGKPIGWAAPITVSFYAFGIAQ